MDYETKPTSRKDIRRYAEIFRRLFQVGPNGCFPVLEALELVPDVFQGSSYEIVEDDKLSPNTMANCYLNNDGGYTIQIKESVYNGAYEKGIGAYLGFICHEMCHVFLFTIGFTPIHARSFGERELPCYCSVEWQCKALTGEVMIPYRESRSMNEEEIIDTYHVSKAFARMRVRQERRWYH